MNRTSGHFITKEIEVNQGHSKTKTYRPNTFSNSNDVNQEDQNIYIDSQSSVNLPSVILQPPHYDNTDNNGSQNKMPISGHRKPKYYPVNPSPFPTRGDLAESGNSFYFIIYNAIDVV